MSENNKRDAVGEGQPPADQVRSFIIALFEPDDIVNVLRKRRESERQLEDAGKLDDDVLQTPNELSPSAECNSARVMTCRKPC